MPDLKISQLTAGGAAQASDEFPIARAGGNNKITGANIAAAATSVGTLTSLTVSGQIGTGNGTVGAPALAASADTNTGIYFPAADTVGITTGGTERMRLDASGNLGLGVTPSAWDSTYRVLQLGSHASFNAWADLVYVANNVRTSGGNSIYLNNGEASQYLQYVGTHRFLSAVSGTAGATANMVERWRINSSGHLLAGADATYDIGASGATRPRDLFLSRNMVGGGWMRAGAASAGAASTTTIGSTTSTTVGATGAADVLPANPLGYIVAHVGTTEVRIPYYNA